MTPTRWLCSQNFTWSSAKKAEKASVPGFAPVPLYDTVTLFDDQECAEVEISVLELAKVAVAAIALLNDRDDDGPYSVRNLLYEANDAECLYEHVESRLLWTEEEAEGSPSLVVCTAPDQGVEGGDDS